MSMPCRPSTLAALVGLLCVAGLPPAHAEAPDAGSAPPDGYGNDADRGLMECPADRIQARKAREAELEGARRLFVTVTSETVNLAHLQATGYFDAVESAFVVGALVRVREALVPLAVAARIGATPAGIVPPEARGVSAEACRALAGRDEARCAGLDASEQEGCRGWLEVWRSTRAGADGCAALAEPSGALCRAIFTQSAATCKGLAGDARANCEAIVAGMAAVETHCGAEFDGARCGWALLSRGVAEGRRACEVIAPSARHSTAEHQRTHQLCLAVLDGEPQRCPETVSPAGRTLPSVAEVAVVGSLVGPWAIVVLASTTPSICLLEIAVSSGGAERAFVSTVRQESWAPTVWRLPLPLSVDPFAAKAEVRSLCVPRISW